MPEPSKMKQDPRHVPLFKYLNTVFGLNLFKDKVPVFENGLIIGDTMITPDMARFFFADATVAKAPPVSAARVPVDDAPPEPNPQEEAQPEAPAVEKKPKRGQDSPKNKEDPSDLVI